MPPARFEPLTLDLSMYMLLVVAFNCLILTCIQRVKTLIRLIFGIDIFSLQTACLHNKTADVISPEGHLCVL